MLRHLRFPPMLPRQRASPATRLAPGRTRVLNPVSEEDPPRLSGHYRLSPQQDPRPPPPPHITRTPLVQATSMTSYPHESNAKLVLPLSICQIGQLINDLVGLMQELRHRVYILLISKMVVTVACARDTSLIHIRDHNRFLFSHLSQQPHFLPFIRFLTFRSQLEVSYPRPIQGPVDSFHRLR